MNWIPLIIWFNLPSFYLLDTLEIIKMGFEISRKHVLNNQCLFLSEWVQILHVKMKSEYLVAHVCIKKVICFILNSTTQLVCQMKSIFFRDFIYEYQHKYCCSQKQQNYFNNNLYHNSHFRPSILIYFSFAIFFFLIFSNVRFSLYIELFVRVMK